MRITRLDQITMNNISFSTQRAMQEQMVFILQDISTTLAMIYDKMCDDEEEIEVEEPLHLLSIEEVINRKRKDLHLETVELPDGYNASYLRTENDEVILFAFGGMIGFKKDEYNKTWRCWSQKPSEEERNKQEWTC